jgi:hypothetical protein
MGSVDGRYFGLGKQRWWYIAVKQALVALEELGSLSY